MNEFLKEVLGENLLNQVNEKLTGSKIKLGDLSTGNYVSKSKFEDELSTRDKQITSLNDTITARDNDLKSLQEQLENSKNGNAEALEKAQSQLATLQQQYADDKAKYQEQLENQKKEYAIKEKVNTLNFSSLSAKRAFTQDVMAQNLSFDNNGNLLGFDDFVSNYEDKLAFASEDTKQPQQQPKIVTKNNEPKQQETKKIPRII